MATLPISKFLTERLTEYDSTFELRKGTGFEQLFFKPMEFIVQPLRDEANDIFVSQSLLRILLTDDPDAYNQESVDSIVSNLFVDRRFEGKSSGVARVYYNNPVTREYPATGAVILGSNGENYVNPSPFLITETQMSTQVEAGFYYFDISVESENSGTATEVGIGELVTLVGDSDVVRVNNSAPISGGLDAETNTELIDRARNSIGVRDLVTGKGFNAILFENFVNNLAEVQPVGFMDNEMMRDIVFNTHIGGRVDGWCKTASITTKSKDFVGLLTDDTRQSFASSNTQLLGVTWTSVGRISLDRSNGRAPIVQEIKFATSATVTSLVSMLTPIDLSVNQYIRLTIDGVTKNVRVAGVNSAATTRNEIINLINLAFGVNIASVSGTSFKLKSPTTGLTSQIVIDNPTVGTSALLEVFGLATGSAPYQYDGDGPVTYLEGVHYDVDDSNGLIRRIVGPVVVVPQVNGVSSAASDVFTDATSNIFLNVIARDILTITSGVDAGDYRILSKTNNNTLVLEKELSTALSNLNYYITRTGIYSGEVVYVQYWFNPVAIDIGKLIKLDTYGRVRGVRTGREDMTITDLPFLRITSIEEIDPLSFEPTGFVLDGSAGFGQGGFGRGPFGIGTSNDYYLVVNSPTERFSMFEDSYIVFRSGLQGLSFRVNYECVPEIESYHDFVRSETERVLDGDILMKHFIPAYVSMTIPYQVDASNTTAPDNDTMTSLLKTFITQTRITKKLELSDIMQFLTKTLDPYGRYSTFVRPFEMAATIHNTDGSTSKIKSTEFLQIPDDVIPPFTTRPLSIRTAHWIADEVVLVRS